MRRLAWVIGSGLAAFVLPFAAHAFTYDVGITHAGVTFTPSPFFVGERVRIYAMVRNFGDRDVEGSIFFSENGIAIGTPPPFSAKARGAEEEVWVEWQPGTVGERQIFVRVVSAAEMRDEDLANNEMIVPVFVDRDSDGDRIGDRADGDDDNDGLPDAWEESHGLNPRDASDATRDPDGDGRSTVDEYRAGTDPFTAPPAARGGGGTSGGGGGSGGTGAPPAPKPVIAPVPTTPPAPTPKPATAPTTARSPSVTKPKPPSPVTAVAGTKIRLPAAAGATTVTTDSAPTDAQALARADTSASPPVPLERFDRSLDALLGDRASGWGARIAGMAAFVVAAAAVAVMVLLRRRRDAGDEVT